MRISSTVAAPPVRQPSRELSPKQVEASLPDRVDVSEPERVDAPPHRPGRVRDFVEKTGGVIGAAARVPTTFVSGVVNGAAHGTMLGYNSEYKIDPAKMGTGIALGNALVGLTTGAATAYVTLGPVGLTASLGKDLVVTGASTYMFIKNGSSAEVGRKVTAKIEEKIQPEDNALQGLVKGAWAGGTSAAKAAGVTGYHEGRSITAGLLDGFGYIPQEVAQAQRPEGSLLRQTAARVAGTAAAVGSAPAGLAHTLLSNDKPGNEISKAKLLSVAAVNGALFGAAAGLAISPTVAAVGGVTGAAIGLFTPVANESFVNDIRESLEKSRADDNDFGHNIANGLHDFTRSLIVGTSAGARSGWDSAVNGLAKNSVSPAIQEG